MAGFSSETAKRLVNLIGTLAAFVLKHHSTMLH
jgi:hypothetical protein